MDADPKRINMPFYTMMHSKTLNYHRCRAQYLFTNLYLQNKVKMKERRKKERFSQVKNAQKLAFQLISDSVKLTIHVNRSAAAIK